MREANRNAKVPQFVRRIELVQKRSIMYYQQQSSQPFLKIVVALPSMVATCRGKYKFSQLSYLILSSFPNEKEEHENERDVERRLGKRNIINFL